MKQRAVKDDFASRFQYVLLIKDLQACEFASLANMNPSMVSRYATGKTSPSLANFRRICAVCRCNPAFLLGVSDILTFY